MDALLEKMRNIYNRKVHPPSDVPKWRQSLNQSYAREEILKANAWENAELAKIKDRYEKLDSTLLSWEEKKRKKARSQLDRIESELERRRQKGTDDFRREIEYIEEISVGARQKAKEKRSAEELKAKEKANILNCGESS